MLTTAIANVHTLLRRNIRLISPTSLEDQADRGAAIKRLNDDAQAYFDWKVIADDAGNAAAALKPGIQASVQQLGAVPDSAPKSHRLETKDYVCTVTIGQTMEIDDETVLQFDLAMHTRLQQRVFDQLFIRTVKYKLSPEAHQLMQHGKLPPQHEEMIRNYFSRSFSADTTSPKLVVESKAAIEKKRMDAIAAATSKRSAKKSAKAGA